MNCTTHPELPAVAFCRACGRALCADCRRVGQGIVYCSEHLPVESAAASSSPWSATPPARTPTRPGRAFLLGLIPGVGAIYNGQYVKGLVHAIVFGLLISILDSHSAAGFEPLFVMLLIAFIAYMAFEAHHTTRRRNEGQPVDEVSSLVETKGRSATGGVVLIVLGGIFLLMTLDLIQLRQIIRFWPLLLIALGAHLLSERLSVHETSQLAARGEQNREVNHERQ